MKPRLLLCLVLILGLSTATAGGLDSPDFRNLFARQEAPPGVVVELIEWDSNSWQWATPLLIELRERLRQRFPETDLAIVSHGGEQFQLTRERRAEQPEALRQLQGLVDDGVDLFVCGTHSSWRDVPADAYLEFVRVAPSGPARINDYIDLGYVPVRLDRP